VLQPPLTLLLALAALVDVETIKLEDEGLVLPTLDEAVVPEEVDFIDAEDEKDIEVDEADFSEAIEDVEADEDEEVAPVVAVTVLGELAYSY
jgi:hypothetical protein